MATSYSNPGGSGDRTASITLTTTLGISGTFNHFINGNTAENDWWFNGEAVSGKVITFDFGAGALKIIDKCKFYASNATPMGTWQWFGSNDGSSYTALGTTFVMNGFSTGQEFLQPSGNTTGYRYYQMRGTLGSTSSGPFFREVEFSVDDQPQAPVSAVAAQTVPAFTQSFASGNVLAAVAAQTIPAFTQALASALPNKAVSSQTVNDFGVFAGVVNGPGTIRSGRAQVGARPRRVM